MDAIRVLLKAVATGRGGAGDGVPALRARAVKALRRTPLAEDPAAPDDLVAAFLASLVRQRPMRINAAEELLALDESRLESVIANRFRQLAAEAGPNWVLVKGLREKVARELPRLPSVPAARPATISSSGRLSSARVGEAVAWLLAQSEPPERTPAALARQLLADYFPEHAPPAALDDAAALGAAGDDEERQPDSIVRRHRDAWRISELLFDELGPHLASTFMRKYAGHTLQQIADEDGCALATVHARLREAEVVLRRLAEEHGIGYGTVQHTLNELGRRLARWKARQAAGDRKDVVDSPQEG